MVRGSARLSSLYSKSTTFERSVSPRFEWGGIGMGMVRKNRARGSRRADPHSQQPGEKTRRGTRQKTEPWCQSPTAKRNHLERPRLRNPSHPKPPRGRPLRNCPEPGWSFGMPRERFEKQSGPKQARAAKSGVSGPGSGDSAKAGAQRRAHPSRQEFEADRRWDHPGRIADG